MPGVAYFMGGEGIAPCESVGTDDPFMVDVEASSDHPQMARKTDRVAYDFALIWLTEAELASGPTPPPPDTRRPGEHPAPQGSSNAWDEPIGPFPWDPHATRWVYLAERVGDPNAGVAPSDPQPGSTYRSPWTNKDLFDSLVMCDDHLGGTTKAGSGTSLPTALTPWYLELATPTWNVDYGNRETHLIDLESDAFAVC